MNPDHVQALVARCLSDPDFLSVALAQARTTRNDPATKRDEAVSILDHPTLERLGLFRGFITKIKHNSLRSVLPFTFCLLARLGEEFAFFNTYSPSYMSVRKHGPLPVSQQLELFDRHLRSFIQDRPIRIRTGITDVLTHEATVWRLRSLSSCRTASRHAGGIRWRGTLEVRRYRINVLVACASLMDRTFDPKTMLSKCDYTLAYWRSDGTEHIEFFEIDHLTRLVFSLVDGHRNVIEIAQALDSAQLPGIVPSDLEEFFAEASQRGFIEFCGKSSNKITSDLTPGETQACG